MSVKAQIERLTVQERRQLSHAFDHGFSQHIKIAGTSEFVGVHINSGRTPNLQILEQVGVWSYGNIKVN